MSRIRIWTFTAVVALALAANFVLLSPRIAQGAEEGLRARLASATAGLKTQLELLDARLSPRGLAQNAELLEALRPPDPNAPAIRPDERALRAAVAVLSPPPDLLVVANGLGAVVSRRGKAASVVEDLAGLGPLRKLLEAGSGTPGFVELDKQLYRVVAARAPGGSGAVLTGAAVDDRLAQQLRSLLDADVAFFRGAALAASSLSPGHGRDELARWQKAPGQGGGYGQLEVGLPFVGPKLDGMLPRGAQTLAVRGALLPLDGGVQAAVTVPAGPALAWLARYQVAYAAGLAALFLLALAWSLFPVRKQVSGRAPPEQQRRKQDRPAPPSEEPEVGPVRRRPRSVERGDAAMSNVASLLGADVSTPSEPPPGKLGPSDVPWSPVFEERAPRSSPPREGRPGRANGAATESLDPDVAPPSADAPSAHGAAAPAAAANAPDPVWASPASVPEEHREEPWHAAAPQAETLPGTPREDLLAQARDGSSSSARAGSPGSEPTRIQPISAALLDKLRETDGPAPAHSGAAPAASAGEADEAHFKDTFEQFLALREQTGEGRGNVSYEKFAARLRKNREDLLAKHGARGVRFAVYMKEGKAAIKASTTR